MDLLKGVALGCYQPSPEVLFVYILDWKNLKISLFCQEVQERKKQDALAAANKLTDALVDHLNVGVAQAFTTTDF